MSKNIKAQERASLLLRVGLASVWLYAAVAATLAPTDWIGFIPLFVTGIVPAKLALMGFSLLEAVLGGWLLLGWKPRYAALLSALMVAGIFLSNLSALIVTFRDIAIFFAALALAVLT